MDGSKAKVGIDVFDTYAPVIDSFNSKITNKSCIW